MAQSEIRKRELHRIRSWISSHEKRGYFVPPELRESLPTLSTQKLKALTSDKLYEKVTYITAEGEEKGGKQGRYQERQERAKKAVATRKANKASARTFYGGIDIDKPEKDTGGFKVETPLGKVNAQTGEYEGGTVFINPKTGKFVDEGEIILNNLWDLIDQYPTKGAEYLKNLLNSEIRQFGEKKVKEALAQMPDYVIKQVQEVVHYIGKYIDEDGNDTGDATHQTLNDFAEMLKGTILTLDEAKEVGETTDSY
jgi:hypothetical protein